jgi:hypothetical protein
VRAAALLVLALAAPPREDVRFQAAEEGGLLVVRRDGRAAAAYQVLDRTFERHPLQARSGYFRELRSPAGRLLTEDAPADHLHHRGLFLTWNRVTWSPSDPADGGPRTANFWELAASSGRRGPGTVSDLAPEGGHAGFTVRHPWRIGERRILDETLSCRIHAPSASVTALDLDWTLAAVGGAVELDEYGHHNQGKGPWYGTLGFRGAAEFAPKDLSFAYPDGLDRSRQDNARAEGGWVRLAGSLEGAPCGVVLAAHPANPPARLSHFRSLRFLCVDVSDPKPVRIVPATPLRLRFRILLHDGELAPSTLADLLPR